MVSLTPKDGDLVPKSKQAKNCSELKVGDTVCGCYTDAGGCECHVTGLVHCVQDDGNVMVWYTHLHSVVLDPTDLTKVS